MSFLFLQDRCAIHADNQAAFLAPCLKLLFPAHVSAYNCIVKLEGTQKTAPVVRRAATLREYCNHLSPTAREGVGALGMYLGEKVQTNLQTWWSMSFLALDFDDKTLAELVSFIDTLVGLGVYLYVSTGTTGRGAHLYIFLHPLLQQKRAFVVVKLLQTMAHDAGLGRPEIRPSSMSGIGSPIFLPYRAAGEDSFGVNPLLDPEDNFCPILLADVQKRVKRVCPETLEALCQELNGKVSESTNHCEKPLRTPPNRSAPQVGDSLTLLEAELERLAEKFVVPHRQDLIMGVTAYGVRGLSLDGTTVRAAVETFIRRNDPDELKRRLEAVERTIKKHKAGQLVAWREFYERAGLASPYRVGASQNVLDQLSKAEQLVSGHTWPGRGGASDRSVYAALLQLAALHGIAHNDGVAVSVSVRNLAVNACLGDMTREKALKRLTESGLVRRDTTVNRRFEDAGVLVLLMDRVHKLCHSLSPKGGLREWHSLYTHPAFMHGKLGKFAAAVLITLLEVELPLTRPDLAKRISKESRAIRVPLAKLLDHKIVCEVDGAYKVQANWEEALEQAAHVTGANRSLENQKQRHAIEREVFQAVLTSRRQTKKAQ